MKNFFQKTYETVATLVAKFYNWMPHPLKIVVMVASSMALSGIFTQLISDINALQNLNGYLKSILDAFTFALGIAINVLQQYIATKGTEILALQKDRATIHMLNQKIADTKELVKSAK